MSMVRVTLFLLFLTSLAASLAIAWRWLVLRFRARQRWYASAQPVALRSSVFGTAATSPSSLDDRGFLGRWLYRAGYRGPNAALVFVVATAACIGFGLLVALGFVFSGLQSLMERSVVLVPGGVGETFLPVVWVAPWLLLLLVGCAPWLIVRRARRLRAEMVERDLPLALELLSTLSEAGLGFDAALSRILKTRLAGRPLAMDLRMFQADLLAGRSRVDSLRRLSARLDLPSVSVFVSALVQAEQLGMGIARVLRQQAEDVRGRRREKSIAFANSLPVKRVIPLVVCFLPGLFVWTLGPAFVQLFKMVDTFLRVQT
jgi:tight adherence protein C